MERNGKTIAAVFALMLGVGAPLAAYSQADRTGVYIGAAAGVSEAVKYCDPLSNPCTPKGTAYKFFAGWQFSPAFAVEVGYTDLGRITQSVPGAAEDSARSGLGEATLTGFLHGSPRASLYGKIGG